MDKKQSPEAADRLMNLIADGEMDADDEMCETDCPEGCRTEPDNYCPHGYESAALTLGVI